MKSTIKSMIDDAIEGAIASSSTVSILYNSTKLLPTEMKKMVDSIVHLNERLNQHEKAIELLCELQKENSDSAIEFAKQTKTTAKRN